MGRRLLTADVCVGGDCTLTLGTVHLESRAQANVRRDQLMRWLEISAHSEHALLCGDFNFDANASENALLHGAWNDAWAGTRVSRRGTMIDRAFFKSARLSSLQGTVLGTDACVEWRGDAALASDAAYPSDHDGLLIDFRVRVDESRVRLPEAKAAVHFASE